LSKGNHQQQQQQQEEAKETDKGHMLEKR